MSAASSARLLRLAFPLVKDFGFTREALARSVLNLPQPNQHTEPLTETAVSSLFGHGDDARRTLIQGWLDEGITQMKSASPSGGIGRLSVRDALHARLSYNEPALQHLPEAFALLASPPSALPPVDPMPSLRNVARIADEACYVGGDTSLNLSWYARRGSLAAIYKAAELHQMTSPGTAHDFLDSMLDTSSSLKQSLDEVGVFSSYIYKGWKGILKSKGII